MTTQKSNPGERSARRLAKRLRKALADAAIVVKLSRCQSVVAATYGTRDLKTLILRCRTTPEFAVSLREPLLSDDLSRALEDVLGFSRVDARGFAAGFVASLAPRLVAYDHVAPMPADVRAFLRAAIREEFHFEAERERWIEGRSSRPSHLWSLVHHPEVDVVQGPERVVVSEGTRYVVVAAADASVPDVLRYSIREAISRGDWPSCDEEWFARARQSRPTEEELLERHCGGHELCRIDVPSSVRTLEAILRDRCIPFDLGDVGEALAEMLGRRTYVELVSDWMVGVDVGEGRSRRFSDSHRTRLGWREILARRFALDEFEAALVEGGVELLLGEPYLEGSLAATRFGIPDAAYVETKAARLSWCMGELGHPTDVDVCRSLLLSALGHSSIEEALAWRGADVVPLAARRSSVRREVERTAWCQALARWMPDAMAGIYALEWRLHHLVDPFEPDEPFGPMPVAFSRDTVSSAHPSSVAVVLALREGETLVRSSHVSDPRGWVRPWIRSIRQLTVRRATVDGPRTTKVRVWFSDRDCPPGMLRYAVEGDLVDGDGRDLADCPVDLAA